MDIMLARKEKKRIVFILPMYPLFQNLKHLQPPPLFFLVLNCFFRKQKSSPTRSPRLTISSHTTNIQFQTCHQFPLPLSSFSASSKQGSSHSHAYSAPQSFHPFHSTPKSEQVVAMEEAARTKLADQRFFTETHQFW